MVKERTRPSCISAGLTMASPLFIFFYCFVLFGSREVGHLAQDEQLSPGLTGQPLGPQVDKATITSVLT